MTTEDGRDETGASATWVDQLIAAGDEVGGVELVIPQDDPVDIALFEAL